MRWLACALALVVLLLSGCGSSAPDRSQLLKQLSAQLHGGSNSLNQPDLDVCIVDAAKGLPTSQLQQAVNAKGNGQDSPATQRLALRLAGPCISQGYGAQAVRARFIQAIVHSQTSVPPAMAACMRQKASAIPTSELGHILTLGGQSQDALRAASTQLGRNLAGQCLSDPGVVQVLRQKFLAPIRAGSGRFSPAFSSCLLHHAQNVSTDLLRQMVEQPASAYARGAALGRTWAHQCIASGVKP